MSEMCTPVHRTTITIGTLFTEVISQFNLNSFTTYSCHMQIFIISLRRTETGRICQTCLEILSRFIKEIDTRAENQLVYQVVLIEAGTHQHSELTHLPFILNKGTGYAYILLHITMITSHNIMQGVILIFKTTGKSSRSKETVVHIAYIHATGYPGQIIRFTISIHVLLRSIITVSIRMLNRTIKRNLMLIFTPE